MLVDLGLVVHLGHSSTSTCPSPASPVKRLTVIDITGIHLMDVQFCGCSKTLGGGRLEYKQLLRTRWFPATSLKPKTAVTFACLNVFHLLTLQGKLTAHDFYMMLQHVTDNTRIDPPPVSPV